MAGTGSDFCRGSGGLFGAWSVDRAFSRGGLGLSSIYKILKIFIILQNSYTNIVLRNSTEHILILDKDELEFELVSP